MHEVVQVCMSLFFMCGAITVLLASILEKYLKDIAKHEWFFFASALPTFLDIFALAFSACLKIEPRNFMRTVALLSLLGIGMMTRTSLVFIVLGRAFAGLIYSQLPFFNRLVVAFSNEHNITRNMVYLNNSGLAGYLLAPLFLLYSENIQDILWCCALLITISFCLISIWIPFYCEKEKVEKHVENDQQQSKILWIYFILLQCTLNLTGSSVFYLVSPILTFHEKSSLSIGILFSLIVLSQMIGNWIVFSFYSQNIGKINSLFIPIVGMSMVGLTLILTWKSVSVWLICFMILIVSFPDSVLTVTAVRLSEKFPDPSKMLALNGMITSCMYFLGPMMNMLFLIHPALPLCPHLFLWFATWCVHRSMSFDFQEEEEVMSSSS